MTNQEIKARKKEEQKWLAQDDANVMARYQEILNDKARMKRALKEAERQANDMQKRTNLLKTVAKKGK